MKTTMVTRLSSKGIEFCVPYVRLVTVAIVVCAAALVFSPRLVPAQSSDGIDDTSAAVRSTSMDEVSTLGGSGWDRIEGTEPDAADGQVLEIPQVVDSGSQAAHDGDANGGDSAASADNSGDSDDAAADRLGNLDDYQNQEAAAAANGFSVVPVPIIVGAPPFSIGTPPTSAGSGGMLPMRPIFVRPGGISPILPTSPMLTPPRSSAIRPGMPLGWWTRAGRR